MAKKPSFSEHVLECVINKHRSLGIGSYGAVYEASYEELPCAAKVLHSSLFEISTTSHKKLVERFEQECELLSKIKHPCIVQFLGIARDPDNTLPVLVMELMDESLTRFLERSDVQLPLHLQVNFSHDIALALAYLHSHDITHRDLSSNNVLLVAGTRVKVTDFGMSIFKSRSRSMLTSCPGTQVYMAPECLGQEVQYSQSIDCFSFGVLVIQIITREFPNPSSRLDESILPSRLGQQNPNETFVRVRVVPEVVRRQNHISLIDNQNPLKDILLMCLSDSETARPPARDICRSLAAIKEGHPLYVESIENSSDYQSLVMKQCDATRDELQSMTSELRKTQSEIGDYQQENERLQLRNQSLERHVSELSQRVQELDIQLLDAEQRQKSAHARGGIKGFLFGDRERESSDQSLQEKNDKLKKVHSEYLLSLRKVAALQSELEQKNRDIVSKNRELREKSEQIHNLRDKMDSLEVDLGIERHRTSAANEELQSKVQELDEIVQKLEENEEQIVDFKTQIEELKESTKLDQETLEKVCLEEITQRDEKLREQSREIESLKKDLKKVIHQPSAKSAKSMQLLLDMDRKSKKEGTRRLKRLLRDLINHDSSSSDSETTVDSLDEGDNYPEAITAFTKEHEHSSNDNLERLVSPLPSRDVHFKLLEEESEVVTARTVAPSAQDSESCPDEKSDKESSESDDDLYCAPSPNYKDTHDIISSPSPGSCASPPALIIAQEQPDDDERPLPSGPSTLHTFLLSKRNIPSCQVYGQSTTSFHQVVLIPSTLTPTKIIPFCQASNLMLPPVEDHDDQFTSPSNSTTIDELPTKRASEHSKSDSQPSLQVDPQSSNTQPATSKPQSQFVMIAEGPQAFSPSTTPNHSVCKQMHQYGLHTPVRHNQHTCVQFQKTRTRTRIGTAVPQPRPQSQEISQVAPVQPSTQTLLSTSSVQIQASTTHTTNEEKVMAHAGVIQTNSVAPHARLGPPLTQSSQLPKVEMLNGAPSDRFEQPLTTTTYLPPSALQSQLGSGVNHYPHANVGESSNEHAMQSEHLVASYSSKAQQTQQTPLMHLQHQTLVQSSGQTLMNIAIHDGAKLPLTVNSQSEMSARHACPTQAQLGSEHVLPRQKVTSPSGIEHDRFPHLEAEKQRVESSVLGSYPTPAQSTKHQQSHPHPDRRHYCRSDSIRNYLRNRSEPNVRCPLHRRDRRPQRRLSRTAPIIDLYLQSSLCGDHGDHHCRFTQQHYPYPLESVDEYFDDEQNEYASHLVGQCQEFERWQQQQSEWYDPHTQQHGGHCDFRPSGRSPNDGRSQPMFSSHYQTSKSSSNESSISFDSPNSKARLSGPADTYDDVCISQHTDEFVQALGQSIQAEEYAVVLIQPEYVDDLNAPWCAIFAVCCRHPNSINALLENLQGPNEPKYSVAYISIEFEEESVTLDIPHEEAEKQGYSISSSVEPCLIKRKEATPPHEKFGSCADSIYPPRILLTIDPLKDASRRQPLNVHLKLIGAKDCVRHFVLKSPLCMSTDRINTKRHTQVHTQLLCIGEGVQESSGSFDDITEAVQGSPILSIKQSEHFEDAKVRTRVPFLHHHLITCDCNPQNYTIDGHDITLRIPAGAVADGETFHFEIGVTLYGPFSLPQNTRPISSIVWLCLLEKDVQLNKPFQLIVPHFLTQLSEETLTYHEVGFVKASHEELSSHKTYNFQDCITKPHFVSVGCRSYGVLISNHCCFYCLKANQTPDLAKSAGYSLVRIESFLNPRRNVVEFCAIYLLETCLRSLEEQFPYEEGYQISRCSDFKFEIDQMPPYIKVVVPSEHNHCDIAMDPMAAKIRAFDIDFWSQGFSQDMMQIRYDRKMYPPRVKMTVCIKSDYSFKLPIRFIGCSSDSQLDVELAFPLANNRERLSSFSSTSTVSQNTDPMSHRIEFGKPKLKETFKQLLPMSEEWKNIGILLGIPIWILNRLESDQPNVHSRLSAMLTEWLKQVNPTPTWTQLVDAVEPFNEAQAEQIKRCLRDLPDSS